MSFLQGEENCERVVGDDIILPSLFYIPRILELEILGTRYIRKKSRNFVFFVFIKRERERERRRTRGSMKSQEVYIGHAKIYI